MVYIYTAADKYMSALRVRVIESTVKPYALDWTVRSVVLPIADLGRVNSPHHTSHGAGQVAHSGTERRRVRTRNARETACVERPLWGGACWGACALPSGTQFAVPEAACRIGSELWACRGGSLSSRHEAAAYELSRRSSVPPVQD
eukprot:scaffold4240_cov73-Phaeocystis_antarctica.AAC.1